VRPSDEPGTKLTVKAVEHSSLALPPWCKISPSAEPIPAAPTVMSVFRLSDAGLPRREDLVAPLSGQRVLRTTEPVMRWSNVLSWETAEADGSASPSAGGGPPSHKPPVGFVPIQPAQHAPLPPPPWRSTPAAVPRYSSVSAQSRGSEAGLPARGCRATTDTDSAAWAVGSLASTVAASAGTARADAATSWETAGTARPSDRPGAVHLYRPPLPTPLPRCAADIAGIGGGSALRFVPWARGKEGEPRQDVHCVQMR